MGRRHNGSRLCIGLTVGFVMLVVGPAASALASPKVRLVNARSNSHAIGLKVIVGTAAPPTIGEASYGQVTPYANVLAGSARIGLSGLRPGDGNPAQVTQQLVDGARYTAVAFAKGSKGFELKVYRDGDARAGSARLRVLHAAPELGSPNIKLGQRTIAEAVAFKEATPYLSISPGSFTLSVVRPGGSSAIFEKRVSLSAGSASTAILAGTAGARERLIMATDETVTPAGAPETGLGGLAGDSGPPWLLVALAALLAGALGGVTQLSLARRSGRR
jgi:Domain of unknown function (DUF4397)